MFRALLAHLQEALHKRHLVYCVRVMSVGCIILVQPTPYTAHYYYYYYYYYYYFQLYTLHIIIIIIIIIIVITACFFLVLLSNQR
jgi:hypothetical protein